MPPRLDRVYNAARELLDIVVAGYAQAAIELPDWPDALALPARQLVTIGPPAWDCALVAVWVERIASHDGNVLAEQPDPYLATPSLRAWLARVQIVRCVPNLMESGDPHPPDVEEAATELCLMDAQLVDNIVRGVRSGEGFKACNDLAFVEWVSVGPQGDLAASTHAYRIDLGERAATGS